MKCRSPSLFQSPESRACGFSVFWDVLSRLNQGSGRGVISWAQGGREEGREEGREGEGDLVQGVQNVELLTQISGSPCLRFSLNWVHCVGQEKEDREHISLPVIPCSCSSGVYVDTELPSRLNTTRMTTFPLPIVPLSLHYSH